MQRQGPKNRSHWENIRAALTHMKECNEPVPQTRLLYVCRSSTTYLPALLEEMEYLGLIKYYYKEHKKSGKVRQTITLTKKGRRVLEILDTQAAMMPTAPWILENTQW